MHIPENYLSPSTCAVMTAAMVPVWGYSINKVRKEIPKAKMPLLGIGAAFSFLGMMFNIPLDCNTYRKPCGGVHFRFHCVADPGLAVWRRRNPCIWCKLL